MSDPHKPADQTYVVIQDGQRVTGPLNQLEAESEAQRLNRLLEAKGQKVQESPHKAQVKQNLYG